MTLSVPKSRLLCVVLSIVLIITAGLVLMSESSPHSGLLTVAAQASTSINTTVNNSVTVSPLSISLGSVLQATGKVTSGGEPLPNASVALHMGDLKLADAITNANGDYSFKVPVGVNYFPAAFSNGATVYTVVEPQNASSISMPSAVTTVSVDFLPLYLIIALIAGAIFIGLYLYSRRIRGKEIFGSLGKRHEEPAAEVWAQAESPLLEARPLEQRHAIVSETPDRDTTATEASPEPTLFAESVAPPVDETPREVATHLPEPEMPESVAETGVLKQADDFFERGNFRQAVNMLYDAVIIDVATTHEVTIASQATHWEKYHTIKAALPEIQEPVLELTNIYELTNYSGRALTEEQRNAAINAFRAIKEHLESANM